MGMYLVFPSTRSIRHKKINKKCKYDIAISCRRDLSFDITYLVVLLNLKLKVASEALPYTHSKSHWLELLGLDPIK